MLRGLYIGAAGMLCNTRRLESITNNMANAATPGYKRSRSVDQSFPELLLERHGGEDAVILASGRRISLRWPIGGIASGARSAGVFADFSAGGLKETGSSTDLALEGPGFFTIVTDQGLRYQRAGNFRLDADGYLVTSDGCRLLGQQGPIRPGSQELVVDAAGGVYRAGDLIDRLRIVDFQDKSVLTRESGTRYAAPPGVVPEPARGRVYQGYLELSNVNPVEEMVRLIEVNRAYEANQRMIQAHSDALGRLIETAST